MEPKFIEEYEEDLVNDIRRESEIRETILSTEKEIVEWFNKTSKFPSELLGKVSKQKDALRNVQLGIGWLKDMIAALKRESMMTSN
jgi:hypothetical protein